MDATGSHLLVGDRFEPGFVRPIDDGVQVVLGEPPADAEPGLVCPPFVNAHTHLGDAALAPLELDGTIAEVFEPPDGLKHRHLRKLSADEAVDGMADAIATMARTGVARFWDFREGGIPGVDLLEDADRRAGAPAEAGILGRPGGMGYEADEVDTLLDRCPGLGLSAARDLDPDVAEAIADHVHDRDGLLALHASEAVREPIDPVLDLDPDLIVHLCQATDEDLDRVVDADVPVAVCPRSNARFDLRPPLPALLARDASVHLGTDNAMFQSPAVLDEVVAALARFPDVAAARVLAAATSDPFADVGPGFDGEDPHPAAVRIELGTDEPAPALQAGEVRVVEVLGTPRNVL